MRSLALWAALVAALVFFTGFWSFAERVRADAVEPPTADGVVALTGGSNERLETGVRLLEQRKGRRLLISGVNRIVTDSELYQALNIDPALGECCIDIGRAAQDTLGNASEATDWAREHGFKRIILVTDDYHMPRSQAELQLAMPEAEIHPSPVRTRFTAPDVWRSDTSAAARLGGEYVKYLVIRGREALIGLGAREEKAAE